MDLMRPLIWLAMLMGQWATAMVAPEWSTTYSVSGVLTIPFAEIVEPFQAYADLSKGKSRIDYYDGMDKTYQREDLGDHGIMYKVVPMTDEQVKNQINCFQVNGTADSPVGAQSILPDLDGFEYKGDSVVNEKKCQIWQHNQTIGHKSNKYTMWLTMIKSVLNPSLSVAVPLRYEMKGYNTLLGSHYDHYYLDYLDFSPAAPDDATFDDFSSLADKCHGWPGPGEEHVYSMNPMREFVNRYDDHVDLSFAHHLSQHDLTYNSEADYSKRKEVFRQNLRYIHSHNRKHLSFKLASNHFSDRTTVEMKRLRGRLRSTGVNGGKSFAFTKAEVLSAPESLDWRLLGAVSPVKDQSVCGSCWAFGTVGTLEGANFLSTGQMVRLSQQALIDCSWGFGNNGCDGGEDFRAYQFMIKHGGIPTEDSYGGYLGADGFCHLDEPNVEMGFQIEGYVNVTSGDTEALRVAIAKHGPISVGIDASHKSLSFYSSGVYFEPKCGNGLDDLDHAVLAVGYGELNGAKYWLIKNSWSTFWGNDGYVLMSQKDNNCGVATAATFVIPKKKKQ